MLCGDFRRWRSRTSSHPIATDKTRKYHVDGVEPCARSKAKADHFRLINWATNILMPASELADRTIPNGYLRLIQRMKADGF